MRLRALLTRLAALALALAALGAAPASAQLRAPRALARYDHVVSPTAWWAEGGAALVERVAREHWPHTRYPDLHARMRGPLIGRYAEHWLARRHPELRRESDPTHPFRDVYRACVRGERCVEGRLAYQVKVHGDGNPATYFRALREPRYAEVEAFIVPDEHREALRAYARRRGRPDLAARVSDEFAMPLRALERDVDAPLRRGRFVSAGLVGAIGFASAALELWTLRERCADPFTLDCAAAAGGLALRVGEPLLLPRLASALGTTLLRAGLFFQVGLEVYDAIGRHGFTWRAARAAAWGTGATLLAYELGGACFIWTGGPANPVFATLAASACGAAAYLLTDTLALWLDDPDDTLARDAHALRNRLRTRLTEARP